MMIILKLLAVSSDPVVKYPVFFKSTCLEMHSGHKFKITFITVQVPVELFSPSNNILCKVVYLYLLSYMTYDKSYFTIEISYRKILLSLILLTFAQYIIRRGE